MLKQEFEKMMFLDKAEVSAEFYEAVNRDYMSTDETKEQYIARVFGTNTLRRVEDAEWVFKRYIKQKEEKEAMKDIAAVYAEPDNVEQAVVRLKMTLQKFADNNGDLKAILDRHTFRFEELLTLLETSLVAQKEELDRLRKNAKRLTKQIDSLAQGQLL